MKHQVLVVAEGEEDIFDIYGYVLRTDGRSRADYVLRKLLETCQSLAELPLRGHSPPELERVGVHAFREVHFKPYRIIYQVARKKVLIHCILDGRRAVQDILERRLLR